MRMAFIHCVAMNGTLLGINIAQGNAWWCVVNTVALAFSAFFAARAA